MKKVSILVLITVMAMASLFAASGYYEKGDTVFSFKGGIVLPDAMYFPNNSNFKTLFGGDQMHVQMGGEAGISYQTFLSRRWAVGGELDYAFTYSNSKLNITTIPATLKVSYIPIQNGKLDVNFHMNAGFSLLKYNNQKFLTPIYCRFTVNPVYYLGSSWGIGIETGVFVNLEVYSGTKKNDTCIGAFSPVLVTISYRH